MVVDVSENGGSLQAGIPKPLFLGRTALGTSRNKYAATGDGQRFLYVAPLSRDAMAPTTIVLNWFAALEPR
jgi:hypothetical protein